MFIHFSLHFSKRNPLIALADNCIDDRKMAIQSINVHLVILYDIHSYSTQRIVRLEGCILHEFIQSYIKYYIVLLQTNRYSSKVS